MSTKSSGSGTKFGPWLAEEIARRGMNRSEFAERIGVSKSTVHRWVNGDRPRGDQIDIIADVLFLDYDLVSTKAGYRPRGLLEIDPNSPTARLMPLIEKVDWETDPERLEKMEMDLRWMIERDREAEKKNKE